MGDANTDDDALYQKGLKAALTAMIDGMNTMIDLARQHGLTHFEDAYDHYMDYACTLRDWAENHNSDHSTEPPLLPKFPPS